MSDFLDAAGGILEQIAPTIAGMLGGPFAAQGVAAIETALGLNPTGNKDAALQAVANATPEQLLALKQEDNRHAEALEKLGLDSDKIGADDRDSARKREMELKDWVPGVLGVLTILGFFVVLTLLAWGLVSEKVTNSQAFLIMLGSLIAMTKDIYAYFFGSSAGSARKDQTISALSK